jgi:hypothetical protein
MTTNQRSGKDVKESDGGLIWRTIHLHGRTLENHEILHDTWSPGGDMNPWYPEYEMYTHCTIYVNAKLQSYTKIRNNPHIACLDPVYMETARSCEMAINFNQMIILFTATAVRSNLNHRKYIRLHAAMRSFPGYFNHKFLQLITFCVFSSRCNYVTSPLCKLLASRNSKFSTLKKTRWCSKVNTYLATWPGIINILHSTLTPDNCSLSIRTLSYSLIKLTNYISPQKQMSCVGRSLRIVPVHILL